MRCWRGLPLLLLEEIRQESNFSPMIDDDHAYVEQGEDYDHDDGHHHYHDHDDDYVDQRDDYDDHNDDYHHLMIIS